MSASDLEILKEVDSDSWMYSEVNVCIQNQDFGLLTSE